MNSFIFKWLSFGLIGLSALLVGASLLIMLNQKPPLNFEDAPALPYWFDNAPKNNLQAQIVPAYLPVAAQLNAVPVAVPNLKIINEETLESLNPVLISGDFNAAFSRLKNAIAEDRLNYQAWRDFGILIYLHGSSYEGTNEGTNAVESLEQAISLKSDSAFAWAFLALAYQADYQPQKAINAAYKALTFHPQLPEVHAALATITNDKASLEHALSLNPKSFWVKLAQVRILEREQAQIVLDDLLVSYPRLALLYSIKGDMSRNSNRTTALTWYNRALEYNPQYVAAHTGSGWVYFGDGKYQEAEGKFNKALSYQPNSPNALVGRGYVKLTTREPNLAIESFSKAILKDSTNAEAYNGLAAANLNKGHLDQVLTWADLAIKHNPNYADPYYHKGRALYEKGDYKSAITAYHQAIKLMPIRPHYQEALAFAYYANGQNDLAKQTAQKALTLKPDNAALTRLLALIK
jgi:tetratricopeptide (TPR) repeat protein